MYLPIFVENDHCQVFKMNSEFRRICRNKDTHHSTKDKLQRPNDSIAIVVEGAKSRRLGLCQVDGERQHWSLAIYFNSCLSSILITVQLCKLFPTQKQFS